MRPFAVVFLPCEQIRTLRRLNDKRVRMSDDRKHVVAMPLTQGRDEPLPPAWLEFIRYCRELRHGEIERLSIQDGLPVLAEVTRQKVKFNRNH